MACVDYLSRPFKNTGNCLMECSLPEAVSVSQFSAYVFKSISFMSWALTHTGKWVLKLGVKCSRKETWDLLRQSCGVLGWEKLKSLENSLGYLWNPDQRCFRGWRLWSPYRCPLEFCTEQFLHCNGSACEWFPEVPVCCLDLAKLRINPRFLGSSSQFILLSTARVFLAHL